MRILLLLLILTAYSTAWAECVSGNCENGTGTYTYFDLYKYVGEWRDGKYHGDGTYTWWGYKYVGEWRDGKKHGEGTQTWDIGYEYAGEFLDHEMHGEGTLTYADGRVQAGVWQNSEYFGTNAEWDEKVERERLAKEKERLAKEKAKEKHDRIYRACLLDKGENVDMQVPDLRKAVVETCEAVAADPSWLDEWRYD